MPGYRVAGKSGTAQIPTPDGYEERATIVSFVGFAPADDPQFVVLVKMDRPDFNINQWASHTAAPVFSRVTKRLLDYYSIPPQEPEPTPEAMPVDSAQAEDGADDLGEADAGPFRGATRTRVGCSSTWESESCLLQ